MQPHTADIDNRFTYHPPRGEEDVARYQEIRAGGRQLAQRWTELMPEGREAALAVTKLEEAVFWANAAIARAAG